MRVQRLILAVTLLACSVTACAVDVTGTAHPPPPLAYVRYVNAVADTFNMDFRAVDQVSYSQPFLDTPFRGLGDGNYQGYQAGSRHIRVFLDPNPSGVTVAVNPAIVSTVMVDTTYTFTAGTYYTVLHVGGARAGAPVAEKLWIIADALPAQSASAIGYRVINAAPVLGAVDVYASALGTTPLTGTPVAPALAFENMTSYISAAVGPLVLRMTTPGTLVTVGAATGYTLQAGTAGTTAVDPIYGSGQAGSIVTAFIFDASPAGTMNSATFTTPGIVFWPDLQPPRTTNDLLRPANPIGNP
jgi:Domain of unknown function (DUF4397)